MSQSTQACRAALATRNRKQVKHQLSLSPGAEPWHLNLQRGPRARTGRTGDVIGRHHEGLAVGVMGAHRAPGRHIGDGFTARAGSAPP